MHALHTHSLLNSKYQKDHIKKTKQLMKCYFCSYPEAPTDTEENESKCSEVCDLFWATK